MNLLHPNPLPIARGIVQGDRFRLVDVEAAWAERRAAIVAHYATSHSYTITGKAFGITYQRVAQIVHRKVA